MDGTIGAVGTVLTYQAMQNLPRDFWEIFQHHRVLVILDEVHHASGDHTGYTNAWGHTILEKIQRKARYTLSLSGTPWRTDCTPVCLADYCHNGQIHVDYSYSLRRAIRERVCRLPRFILVDNQKIQVSSGQDTNTYSSIEHYLAEAGCRYDVLLRDETFIQYMVAETRQKLAAVRSSCPNSGGLIVATSVGHAYQVQKILQGHFSEASIVVTHEDPLAHTKIEHFRSGTGRWIISVGMISEGTDIPRLRVCCYLSRVRTELYFRQVLGRILRVTKVKSDSLEDAFMILPAEPNLEQYVSRVSDSLPPYQIKKHKKMTEDLSLTNAQDHESPELPSISVSTSHMEPETVISLYEQETTSWLHTSNNDEQPVLKIYGMFRQRLINLPALLG